MTVTPSPSVPRPAGLGLAGAAPFSNATIEGAVAEAVGLLVIDSCHSTWLFDAPERRFRRLLKGLDVDPSLAATEWRPYVSLELSDESEAFVVVLNESGTRRIRSWRHVESCDQCDGERTTELSVDDIRRLTQA